MTKIKLSWNSIPLHHRILGALVLGAIFGALFNISKYELEVTTTENRQEQTSIVRNWETIEFFQTDSVKIASYGKEDQLKVIRFSRINQKNAVTIKVKLSDGKEIVFKKVQKIEKVKTIAVLIRPVGQIFLRLLMFAAIPLVLASLIVGAASLGDIRRVGKVGGKTLLFYLFTIIVAITIGLTLVNIFEPGKKLSADSKEKLMTEFQQPEIQTGVAFDVVDMVVKLVPTNPIRALAESEMLQVIFFALMVGVSLTLIKPDKSKPVIDFFDGFSEMMIKMVGVIMQVAPFGVFALISATVGEFGFDILGTLFWYAAVLLAGLLIHTFGVLPVIVRVFSKIPIKKFLKGMEEPMLVAFTTSSSAATLPVNMKACENNLGVPKKITSFVLPLGATVNMDGTSMYQAVATVFIAQVYGFDLNLGQQLTILLMAVLASIGTAPVPGVGLIMLIIVLRSVNVPEEGIALILGIDRFLDMCRTVPNILGDAAVSTIIARSEGVLGEGRN